MPGIQVHGHRGARAIYPENTLPAFEYAIRVGADALEMDLAVTKDNVLVISHDPHVNGIAIRELTRAELHLPALDEVLSLAPLGSFRFNIEIKSFPEHPELTPPPDVFARMLLDEIRTHRVESRVIVQSFDFRTLRAMRQLAPEISLAALWEGDPHPFPEIAKWGADARIIAPLFTLVTREQVRASHAAGIEVIPWTANSEKDWQTLIDAGVDAIITDDPAALIGYLMERGLR
jgi:glycerophosphoryl diester phosphodiesterase